MHNSNYAQVTRIDLAIIKELEHYNSFIAFIDTISQIETRYFNDYTLRINTNELIYLHKPVFTNINLLHVYIFLAPP